MILARCLWGLACSQRFTTLFAALVHVHVTLNASTGFNKIAAHPYTTIIIGARRLCNGDVCLIIVRNTRLCNYCYLYMSPQ